MTGKNFAELAVASVGSDDHARLLAVLQVEEEQAMGYRTDAEVAEHIEALDRYFGRPYGNEISGRSQITTRELQETISWLLPDLLDIFAAGGRICDLEATKPEAEQGIEQRADYLNYVFFRDNPGLLVLYDFLFDSLLHRRAYVDIDWSDKAIHSAWQSYDGLTPPMVEEIVSRQGVEVDGFTVAPVEPSEAYPTGEAYSLRARYLMEPGKASIEVVPPEDMFVAARVADLRAARYKGRLLRWRRAQWKRLFPDFVDEIDGAPADGGELFRVDESRDARFGDADDDWERAAQHDADELIGRKEYIYWTKEGEEGEASEEVLLRVYRIGGVILDVEEVDEDPFASATAHRIPHRLQGLSLADLLGDLQKLKTVLTRALVDATMQANVPRIAADQNAVNLNDLLNLDVGAVVRTTGHPGAALMPLETPDVSASTLQALEWANQIIEQRTGVSRHAQGLDPDSLNHTARGIQLLQNAANGVKRMIARLLAVGIEEMMEKLDRVLMRHQRQERSVAINKQWVKVNPASWHPAMRVEVSVGLGTGSKEAQLGFLQMIQGDQMLAYQQFGPTNPVVTLKHLHATITEKIRVMGYKSADKFFGEPIDPQTGQPWAPQPQPGPDQQKAQAEMQEAQARLQMDMQRAQAETAAEAQKLQQDAQLRRMEADAKVASDAQRAELEAQVARMRAGAEIEIMREKMQLQLQLERERMEFEAQMKLAQFEFEKDLQRQEMELKRQAMKAKTNGAAPTGISQTQFGGEPG